MGTAFSRDGRTLAAVDKKGRIALWDVETGTKMLEESTVGILGGDEHFETFAVTFAAGDSALVAGFTEIAGPEKHRRAVILVWHAPR